MGRKEVTSRQINLITIFIYKLRYLNPIRKLKPKLNKGRIIKLSQHAIVSRDHYIHIHYIQNLKPNLITRNVTSWLFILHKNI